MLTIQKGGGGGGWGGRKALSINKFSKIHEIMENIIYIMPNYNLKKKFNGQ